MVSADGGTVIRPHFVSLSETGPGPVLVFLEDTSVVAERVQQSKLASLGRLSASIAHEIRNPVGAMSHAGQLLRESPALGADDRHLTDIIEKNATRVSQIIESVLQLSRRETTRQERIGLEPWLRGFVEEFTATSEVAPATFAWRTRRRGSRCSSTPRTCTRCCGTCATTRCSTRHAATVDPVALRIGPHRVQRPAVPRGLRTAAAASIPRTRSASSSRSSPTRRAGTGLGLFISRELCQTNGAVLAYETRPGGGSIFRIIFADPPRWE